MIIQIFISEIKEEVEQVLNKLFEGLKVDENDTGYGDVILNPSQEYYFAIIGNARNEFDLLSEEDLLNIVNINFNNEYWIADNPIL